MGTLGFQVDRGPVRATVAGHAGEIPDGRCGRRPFPLPVIRLPSVKGSPESGACFQQKPENLTASPHRRVSPAAHRGLAANRAPRKDAKGTRVQRPRPRRWACEKCCFGAQFSTPLRHGIPVRVSCASRWSSDAATPL